MSTVEQIINTNYPQKQENSMINVSLSRLTWSKIDILLFTPPPMARVQHVVYRQNDTPVRNQAVVLGILTVNSTNYTFSESVSQIQQIRVQSVKFPRHLTKLLGLNC